MKRCRASTFFPFHRGAHCSGAVWERNSPENLVGNPEALKLEILSFGLLAFLRGYSRAAIHQSVLDRVTTLVISPAASRVRRRCPD